MKETSVLGKAFSVNKKNNHTKPEQDIRTPKWLFDKLHEQFDFKLDPCDSRKHPNWLGIPCFNLNDNEDGLVEKWRGNVFVNPPWSKKEGTNESLIQYWIEKAESELEEGNCNFVVMLLPSRVETHWWHYLLKSVYLMNHRYLKSRVQFEGQPDKYVIGISIFVLWRNLY